MKNSDGVKAAMCAAIDAVAPSLDVDDCLKFISVELHFNTGPGGLKLSDARVKRDNRPASSVNARR